MLNPRPHESRETKSFCALDISHFPAGLGQIYFGNHETTVKPHPGTISPEKDV